MSRRHVAGGKRSFVSIVLPSLCILSDCYNGRDADTAIVDFFLQAHTALQGTAKPSHYVVIYDEMNLGAEELQTITHHL